MTTVATPCQVCQYWNTAGSAYCESCGGSLRPGGSPYGPPRVITIGREPDNAFPIPKGTVSKYHAQLEVTPDDRLILRDLGSLNKTYLNTPEHAISTVEVQASDTIYLGRMAMPVYELLARQPISPQPVFRKPEQVSVKIDKPRIVFGRDPGCDYPLEHPMVSFRHAILYRTSDSRYFIEDLQSRNGTWVNGKRLEPNRRKEIRIDRDEISFGSYSFRLTPGGNIERRETGREIRVIARDIGVEVPDESGGMKKILEGASLAVEPGDLVALMGPSGAGKTTLLTALNGMVQPSEGQVFYQRGNSAPVDLREYYDQIRPMIGYVPQEDIMHPQLTVRDALYYTAKLRLPQDYTEEQIQERIRTVLSSMGLWEEYDPHQPERKLLQDTIVGDANRRGISGGQRKRVNLAMELLSEPSLLFLDEPTSGLSAVDSRNVIELLQKLAAGGCTIVVTIHQPSIEVYQMFKLLCAVSNHPRVVGGNRETGRLVYFGPAMTAFEFFGCCVRGGSAGIAPQRIEEEMMKQPVDYWVRTYQASPLARHYESLRGAASRSDVVDLPPVRRDHIGQFLTVAARYVKLKLRDSAQTGLALGLPVVFGSLVAMSFRLRTNPNPANPNEWPEIVSSVSSLEFLMVVAAFWFGCNNAIREIVGERAVYRRERMVNLSNFAYLGSKYVVLGILALVQCLVMYGIACIGADMKSSFAGAVAVLWLTSVAGTGLGLCLSGALPTVEAAIASLPLVLLPMIVLGGGMTPLYRLRHQSDTLRTLADVAIPTRWAYEANLIEESRAKNFHPTMPDPDNASKTYNPDIAEASFPAKEIRHDFGDCVGYLGIFAGILGILAGVILKLDEVPGWKQLVRGAGHAWRSLDPAIQTVVIGLVVCVFVAAALVR